MDSAKEIATLQMQLAATVAALQTFINQNEKLLPKRTPPPVKSYFGGKAKEALDKMQEDSDEINERILTGSNPSDGYEHSVGLDSDPDDDDYKAAKALLCSATKDNFAEIAQSIIHPNGKRPVETEDTDSVRD